MIFTDWIKKNLKVLPNKSIVIGDLPEGSVVGEGCTVIVPDKDGKMPEFLNSGNVAIGYGAKCHSGCYPDEELRNDDKE